MTHTLKVLAALSLSTGCATLATSTPYQQRPPTAVAEVAVFTDTRPDRPYEELGLIEVKQGLTLGGYGELVERAREEGARMGADGIIVTRTPGRSTNTVGTTNDRGKRRNRVLSSVEHEIPRITVTAIVWKAAPTP